MDYGNLYDAESDEDNPNPFQKIQTQQQSQDQNQQQQNQDGTQEHYGDGVSDVSMGDQSPTAPSGYQYHSPNPAQQGPFMGSFGRPADQEHYHQVMGFNPDDINMNEQMSNNDQMADQMVAELEANIVDTSQLLQGDPDEMGWDEVLHRPEPQYPDFRPTLAFLERPRQQQQPLTDEEILNTAPGVQIGETRFPNIAAAIDGYPAVAPALPDPILLEPSNFQWDQSMVDDYPWYDDGPRAQGETRADWKRRVTNARLGMGIIRRQEPPNMDGPRVGETVEQVRRRRDNAEYRSKQDDTQHKRRLDPVGPEYDANYARIWLAQQGRIRNHNTLQRRLWLNERRHYDQQNNRPAGLDPVEPDDDGDDLYDFSFHRMPSRTIEGRATIAQQHQEGIQQARQSGAYDAAPTTDRCKECRRHKKKCDLKKTGFPCTRCHNMNTHCEDEDNPKFHKAKAPPKATGTAMRSNRCLECILRKKGCDLKTVGIPCTRCRNQNKQCPGPQGSTSDSANESFISDGGVDASLPSIRARPTRSEGGLPVIPARQDGGISARPSRRDEPPARPRSASPEPLPAPTYSAKCDNCTKFGWFCDDARPCFMCITNNLACNESYQGNPYGMIPGDGGSGGGNGGDFGDDGQVSNWPATNSPPIFDPADDSTRYVPGFHDPPPYRDFDKTLNFASDVSQLGQLAAQGAGNSVGVVTEPAASSLSQSEDELSPFARQRMLANQNTGFGAPFEIAFRPGRGLYNAARGSPVYNGPAPYDDEATVSREIRLLNQRSETYQYNQERLAQTSAQLLDAVGLSNTSSTSTFVVPAKGPDDDEPLPESLLLTYDGSGVATGPARVDLSNYSGLDGAETSPSFQTAGFDANAACNEWKNRFNPAGANYRVEYCNRSFAKACQTISDHTIAWHSCAECHDFQNTFYKRVQNLINEKTKAYLCMSCSVKKIAQKTGKIGTCDCMGLMRKQWMCHAHREQGLQKIDAKVMEFEQYMIGLKGNKTFCVGCSKHEGDRNSYSWGCKSCRVWVSEGFEDTT